MPPIPQHYLDCSIYLYDSRESAEKGENFGGSGCLISVHSHPLFDPTSFDRGRYTKVLIHFPPHIYAVTNKHVARGGFPVIRLNTIDGEIDVLELEQSDWIPHPDGDDLAVAPIDLPEDKHDYYPIDISDFAHRESLEYSLLGAGDDTFMVGRFISHGGKQRNTPSLRFGSIAMLPFEKVKLEGGHMQEAFLVETRSISGYSGSPVFVYRPTEEAMFIQPNPYSSEYIESNSKSITNLVGSPALLGIDCGHVRQYRKIVDGRNISHPHGWKVEANTGMAIVIPAWRLRDLLDIEDLVMQREQKNKRMKEEKEAEEQSGSVTFDVEKPESITKESYQDALRRASQKTSEPESEMNEK